jgi:hypothetical protein
MREGRVHAGIVIIVQQRWTPGEIIRRMRRLSDNRTPADMRNWVEFLSDWGEE